MQDVINPRDIIKQLNKNGLNIGDKRVLTYHIRNFNYNTFIYGYSEPFYLDASSQRYDRDANSDELINLYKFDRDMANHILRYILVIEKIINTNVVYETINHFSLRDKCLFKLSSSFIENKVLPNLSDIDPKISYANFCRKLVKFLPSSHMTKKYADRNSYDEVLRWKNCPLDVMCLTWSFATSFSFFIASSPSTRERVLNNFDLNSRHLNGFIDFLKNTLHLRNYISHNNVIYNIRIVYQSPAILELYNYVFHETVCEIKLIHMMKMIEHFSHSTTLVSNTKYYFSKLKIQEKFKHKINLFDEKDC